MEKRYEAYLKMAEKQRERIFAVQDHIWKHPETGFREWETHKYLVEQFESLGYKLTLAGNIPGFYTEADTGKPGPTLLVMAEMDAVACETHPAANPETHAVHACGHCGQCAGIVGLAAALKEPGALDGLCGKIRLMCVPAEELIELDYREQLRQSGTVKYYSGKQEFISRGFMDGVDLAAMIHSSTVQPAGHVSIATANVGCMTKSFVFKGKSTHAGSTPQRGINALYAATQALSACNALRETYVEADYVRFHPILPSGGTVVNAIPDHVTAESNVRGATPEVIIRENEKINRAIAGSALSLGANVTFCDRPGYMPLRSDENMRAFGMEAIEQSLGEGTGKITTKVSTGCTDMGDISSLWPSVYMHAGGAVGQAHGSDFYIADVESVCVNTTKILLVLARMLLENGAERAQKVIREFTPTFKTKEDYFAALAAMTLDCEAITYHDDGTATVRYKA